MKPPGEDPQIVLNVEEGFLTKQEAKEHVHETNETTFNRDYGDLGFVRGGNKTFRKYDLYKRTLEIQEGLR